MAHPFLQIFEKALARSHGDENVVLGQAERLIEEGYPPREVYDVLAKLKQSLLVSADEAIVAEALEEISRHLAD